MNGSLPVRFGNNIVCASILKLNMYAGVKLVQHLSSLDDLIVWRQVQSGCHSSEKVGKLWCSVSVSTVSVWLQVVGWLFGVLIRSCGWVMKLKSPRKQHVACGCIILDIWTDNVYGTIIQEMIGM